MITPRAGRPPAAATASSTAPAAACTGSAPRPLGRTAAVVLHLVPGAALLVFFVLTAPRLRDLGLPPVWGLLLGTLLVLAPAELGAVLWSHRGHGRGPWWQSVGLRPIRRTDLRDLLLAGLLSAVGPGLVVWSEPLLRTRVFGRLPDWFGAGVPDLSAYPVGVAASTVVLWLVAAVIVGPVVEEIWFRGWLLPRLPGPPLAAASANAALFAAYHLWQPYAVLTVFLVALPLAVLVRRRHNPALSIVVHCTINLLAFAALLGGALQR